MDSSTTTTRRSSVTSQRASRLCSNSVPQHLRGRVLSRREALVDRSDDSPPVPSPLSFVQMLVSSMCGNLDGGVIHLWPVDYGVDACHAWQGLGTDGRLHTNSAKNMKCEDGVFKFTRYAGNLDSSGSGVDKEIGTTCEQDIVVKIRMELYVRLSLDNRQLKRGRRYSLMEWSVIVVMRMTRAVPRILLHRR